MSLVQKREPAEAVAAAGLGVMYHVIGHSSSDLWGSTRESFAVRAAAADVPEGPAADLLGEAGQEVVDRRAGEAAVDPRDKVALRELGLEQVAGVLPVLGQPPAAAAEISDVERRALDAICGVLSV